MNSLGQSTPPEAHLHTHSATGYNRSCWSVFHTSVMSCTTEFFTELRKGIRRFRLLLQTPIRREKRQVVIDYVTENRRILSHGGAAGRSLAQAQHTIDHQPTVSTSPSPIGVGHADCAKLICQCRDEKFSTFEV